MKGDPLAASRWPPGSTTKLSISEVPVRVPAGRRSGSSRSRGGSRCATKARNRLAWLLLVGFVPVWHELMLDTAGHTRLTFRLYANGRVLAIGCGHLALAHAQ